MAASSTDNETRSSPSNLAKSLTPDEGLRVFRLLEALRKYGDTESENETSKQNLIQLLQSFPQNAASNSTPLHLAVKCATLPALQITLNHRKRDLNVQDTSGSTPLHLAAKVGRPDIVSLLLSQPDIDDTIKDNDNNTCLEVAKGPEEAIRIQVSRAKLNATYHDLLHAYVNDGSASDSSASANTATNNANIQAPPRPSNVSEKASFGPERDSLYNFVTQPRARAIDFRARTHNGRGGTVLHEAARKRDLELLQVCVSRGADVLSRDGRGKLPLDVARSELIRNFLKQAVVAEGRALKAASTNGSLNQLQATGKSSSTQGLSFPERSGYLLKWTNLMRGYRSRWFVLSNGVLTYYRHQDDEGKASRGDISMSIARVAGPSDDKLKFEVADNTGTASRFYLKASHPVEAMRWVEDLKLSIECARAANTSTMNLLGTSPTSRLSITSTTPASSSNNVLPLPQRTFSSASTSIQQEGSEEILPSGDNNSGGEEDDEMDNSENPNQIPHADTFGVLASSTRTQVETTEQLLESLIISSNNNSNTTTATNNNNSNNNTNGDLGFVTRQNEVKEALRQSLHRLSLMLEEYHSQVADREQWYLRRYEKEMDAKKLWEENMREAAEQYAKMEDELKRVAQDNSRKRKALKSVRASMGASHLLNSATGTPDSSGLMLEHIDEANNTNDGDVETATATITSTTTTTTGGAIGAASGTPNEFGLPEQPSTPTVTGTGGDAVSLPTTPLSTLGRRSRHASVVSPSPFFSPAHVEVIDKAVEGDSDSSDDDDFYDAITESALIKVDQHLVPTSEKEKEEEIEQLGLDSDIYKGYRDLRITFPLKADDRPPVSLWAVFKGSIGKDLTRISFPVYFNEPTSMLQRMAEDMEFSECLDAAANNKDSTQRIAYVAAFAMSNYSSTIGRIAKPFNPMLSETFEYARLDKGYRYISEQVSHHPPISACVGESPTWSYYGEVDAKSKFLGKSFEIRPTGVAHVELYIPQEWAPDHPPAPGKPGFVKEHYTFTKVTTNISGFIMGAPTIDHFGDMVLTNHQTNEKCILTFKPRGWRGKDAYEIKGRVIDEDENEYWEIAGKWSTQLVARRSGLASEGEDLQPDTSVPQEETEDNSNDDYDQQSGESHKKKHEYILLWKNSEKPENMPFNLTPFAVTLNDLNPDLSNYLPPTDCRLRPDQHAFEAGEFEHANDLKSQLEEFQRATRRKRERGEVEPHKPRWFTRKRHPDLPNVYYWEPSKTSEGQLEYWAERERVGKARRNGIKEEFKGVDHIFGSLESR